MEIERRELETIVDEMFERTDAEAFRIMHMIADLAVKNAMEGELVRDQAVLLRHAA